MNFTDEQGMIQEMVGKLAKIIKAGNGRV